MSTTDPKSQTIDTSKFDAAAAKFDADLQSLPALKKGVEDAATAAATAGNVLQAATDSYNALLATLQQDAQEITNEANALVRAS